MCNDIEVMLENWKNSIIESENNTMHDDVCMNICRELKKMGIMYGPIQYDVVQDIRNLEIFCGSNMDDITRILHMTYMIVDGDVQVDLFEVTIPFRNKGILRCVVGILERLFNQVIFSMVCNSNMYNILLRYGYTSEPAFDDCDGYVFYESDFKCVDMYKTKIKE